MADPKTIGKYVIQGRLGAGGMGVVYKGWDPAIARAVAIKGVNKSAIPDGEVEFVIGRFRQEAQAVGRLVHPRIVQIYDYLEDEQAAYIVMELVRGKTLAHHLAQHQKYELFEIGQIISQILDGIGYAHSHGVVHRDLKPANIMVNDDGRIKINDFGVAHVDSSTMTKVGDVIGTPSYMSPEQFMGGEIGSLADLFCVAIIAYELLTGRKPFIGDSPAALMRQILNENPPPPSSINPKLSHYVDEVLAKALSKSPSNRYCTAKEFSDEFKEAIRASIELNAAHVNADIIDISKLFSTAQSLSSPTPQPVSESVNMNEGGDSPISLDTSVKKARLLIVDDEERILNALKSLFRQRYHVFTTTDGNKALDFITRYQMHVIISDQRMPIMPGVELLRRSREISPHSVRILLTGYSDLAAIVGCINDGEVYRFISKPWDDHALHTIVSEAVTIALELADTKDAAVTLPKEMQAGVLVVDDDEEVFRIVRELIGGLCPVVYAADMDAALDALQKQEIAVVLADVGAGKTQLTTLLKLLKQEYPQVLSMVITKAKDAEMVIDLINQAQVFRILNKPIQVKQLKSYLHAALQRYLTYAQAPKLVQMHTVEKTPNARSSGLAMRILEKLKLFSRA
ncbi:MAG: protein kinase [Gallionella sp.]|nr:protein kinase [Gallionella sp.]